MFFEVVKFVLMRIWDIMIAFWDVIEMDDFIRNCIFYFAVLLLASIGGTCISAKFKKKTWLCICVFFDVVSFLGVIFSISKLG